MFMIHGLIKMRLLIVIAVSHEQFKKLNIDDLKSFGKKDHIIYDIKCLFPQDQVDGRL